MNSVGATPIIRDTYNSRSAPHLSIFEARKLFCQLAVRKMGYPGAGVARFLGVTTSAVNKAANSEEVSSLKWYL